MDIPHPLHIEKLLSKIVSDKTMIDGEQTELTDSEVSELKIYIWESFDKIIRQVDIEAETDIANNEKCEENIEKINEYRDNLVTYYVTQRDRCLSNMKFFNEYVWQIWTHDDAFKPELEGKITSVQFTKKSLGILLEDNGSFIMFGIKTAFYVVRRHDYFEYMSMMLFGVNRHDTEEEKNRKLFSPEHAVERYQRFHALAEYWSKKNTRVISMIFGNNIEFILASSCEQDVKEKFSSCSRKSCGVCNVCPLRGECFLFYGHKFYYI